MNSPNHLAIVKNKRLRGSEGKPMATDIFYRKEGLRKPVVLYAHGFNGFKDWGGFDHIAVAFANAGFAFVKFNFSHNGTTPDAPEDFVDLRAYSENTYTRELNDLGAMIDWICDSSNEFSAEVDSARIGLIGHSRGGGIALLKAAEDSRVKALSTWASVAECKTPWGSWGADKMEDWKQRGIAYITNSRTNQELPLCYSLYEDYLKHEARLDISRAANSLRIPLLICHGRSDTSVPVEKALLLHSWMPDAELYLNDSDHVFGRRHPWAAAALPPATNEVVVQTIDFFRRSLMQA